MSIVRFVARPLLATGFVASGVDRLRNAKDTAAQLRPTLERARGLAPAAAPVFSNELLVARVMGATQVGAGILLGLGKFSRIAALALSVTSALNAMVEYKEADTSSPEAKKARRNQLLKNVSLIGAVVLASVDTEGKPGLAWRVEHLATDTRKGAKTMTKDAQKKMKKADKAVRNAASDVVGS